MRASSILLFSYSHTKSGNSSSRGGILKLTLFLKCVFEQSIARLCFPEACPGKAWQADCTWPGAPVCVDRVHGDSHSHQVPLWRKHNSLATSWVLHREPRWPCASCALLGLAGKALLSASPHLAQLAPWPSIPCNEDFLQPGWMSRGN